MDSTRPHQPLVAENFTNNIDVFPSREDLLDQSTDGLDEFASDFVSDVDSQQDRDSYYRPSTPFAQKLASLDPSLYTGSGDDFCTEDNFDQTSAHVNHQLGLYGYVSNLRFLDGDMHSATRIVSTFFKLLQQHQRDIKYKEEIELNWKRLTRDYDNTAQTLSEVKAQLERSRRDVDTLSARTESLEGDLRVEADKHRNTREELKAAKANLQFTKTQHTHELRKKEQEMNILKDKVQKTINRNQSTGVSSTISGGITVLNPVPRTLYGKQPTNDAEQLLKNVIEQQTTREGEIVEENEQLRKALYTVHTELEGLLQKQTSPKSAATNLYGLPFEMIRDNIESEIRDTLTLLSDQWNHQATREPEISPTELVVRDQRIEELQHEVERMQLELEDSTALIQGAQQMIDNLTQGNFLAGVQDFKLNVDGSDMTLQELNEAETKLQQQKTKLEKERKDYTQACLKLGRERENLQREKLEFEEAKRTYTVDKFMSLLSSPPT
ncbi:hypothetical protein BGW38_006868 [Lunasporangiospora selenospora]|uniref:Afadin and alpha-actinin-binding-domain-containing protein n=1 Tax=Lunasporangiospora selenospora TaxID=979761 RepID=A0A9P6FZK5_9FUNG|nr:hypothetical protein BGW38_006868 [Lunasporangiospora selenospora]